MLTKIKNYERTITTHYRCLAARIPVLGHSRGITSGFHKQRRIATMQWISLSFFLQEGKLIGVRVTWDKNLEEIVFQIKK